MPNYSDTSQKTLWAKVHAAFHQPGTEVYKWTDRVVWALIVASMLLLNIELVSDEPPPWFDIIDTVVLWLFVIEYVLRMATFRPAHLDLFDGGPAWRIREQVIARLRYALTPMRMLDLLAILAVFPVMRGLRALRALRLLRGVRFFRYSTPAAALHRSFHENTLLYAAVFVLLFFITTVGGVSIYLVESGSNESIRTVSDGIWWALVTLTTVGFGDITPQTTLGRVVGGAVMVLGMFTLALFAGIVGSSLLRVFISLREDQFRMARYSNHIVVLGYDHSARLLLHALLQELADSEQEVLVVADGERPSDLHPRFIWINGDPSRESELEKLHLTHAATVIVLGSRSQSPQQADATSILVTFTIRSYMANAPETEHRKRPLYMVTEILDPENVRHARTAGADEVVETTQLGFALLAHAALVPGSGQVMGLFAKAGEQSVYVDMNPTSDERTFGELSRELRAAHGVVLLGLDREPPLLNPDDEELVRPNEPLIYLADRPRLRRSLVESAR